MITRRAFSALTVGATALALAPAALAQQNWGATVTEGTAEGNRLPDMVLGNPDAPVTVVAYESMTCPHCAGFHAGSFKELKSEYIDTGKVNFVTREFPFDPLAAGVFMLARCSGEKYYDVVEVFFQTQRQWAIRQGALTEIRKIARQTGFTDESFEACLTNQQLLDGINAVKDHGYQSLGVRATPTIFIDGEKLEGPRNMRSFRDAIEPKLDS
ncbi:MAG: DsbA family protein [Pseudomonadota bacterium]